MILIAGGAGYIGSHANKVICRRGYQTVIFDNLVYGHREFVKWGEFFYGDLADKKQIRSCFEKYPVDAVMHFSAYAYVGGGHGRSGTAITALLLCADSQATPSKAISLVRERHCKNAVESETQDLYLLEVWRTLLKNKGGLTDDEIDEMIEDEYDILNPPKKAAKVYDLRDTPVHVGSQKSLPVGTSSPNKGIIRFWRPEKSHVNTNAQGMLDSNRRCTLCGMTIVNYEHWFKSTAGFVYAGKTGDPGKIVDLCDLCVATLSGKEKASSVTPPSIIPYE